MTVAELNALRITLSPLPKHVGIIMDGNGRYATRRGLPRSMGHRAGTERLRGIIKLSSDLGIEALSLYAFSTENWKRPKIEVDTLHCRKRCAPNAWPRWRKQRITRD